MGSSEFIVVPGSQVVNTPTTTRVAAATTSTTVRAANGKRLTLKLTNDSSVRAWMLYGEGATTENFTWVLDPGERWEMPSVVVNSSTRPEYNGIMTAVWESAIGAMQVTEVTI
jgi:hypothetical protein